MLEANCAHSLQSCEGFVLYLAALFDISERDKVSRTFLSRAETERLLLFKVSSADPESDQFIYI